MGVCGAVMADGRAGYLTDARSQGNPRLLLGLSTQITIRTWGGMSACFSVVDSSPDSAQGGNYLLSQWHLEPFQYFRLGNVLTKNL
jgi:hypothetical protein